MERQFADELAAWRADPDYFDNNAQLVVVNGYWDWEWVCHGKWGDPWGWDCGWEPEWVPGYSYWSYDHFSQKAIEIAEKIAAILNGDPLATFEAVKGVVEDVFGVSIGGDIFADILIGDSVGDQPTIDFYTVILSLSSTENVHTGQTPSCIKAQYHKDRYQRYIEPNIFVSYLGGIFATNTDLFDLSVTSSWRTARYTFLVPFGWFDAKHAAIAFKLGDFIGDDYFREFEILWEGSQGCGSKYIREDIFSNEVGREAARQYAASTAILGEQLIYNQISATAVTRIQAQVYLATQSIIVP